MALSERDQKILDELAAQITWPLGSQGVCDGLSGQEAEDFADFTRFVEGQYIVRNAGSEDETLTPLGWEDLPVSTRGRFSRWLPKGGRR